MTFLLPGALIFLVAYLLGSIPFGLLIARTQGIDIREHGSKNIGATNVWRVLGKKFGLATFLCDMLKGVVAVVLGGLILARFPGAGVDVSIAGITGAIGVILGHNFPVWLTFKGGKGVATSLGVLIGLMWLPSLLVLVIWGVVFKTSRYVSLASIVAAIALPLVVLALMAAHLISGMAYFYFACAASALVIRRHKDNITRLRAGTENRFGTPKAKPPESAESANGAA